LAETTADASESAHTPAPEAEATAAMAAMAPDAVGTTTDAATIGRVVGMTFSAMGSARRRLIVRRSVNVVRRRESGRKINRRRARMREVRARRSGGEMRTRRSVVLRRRPKLTMVKRTKSFLYLTCSGLWQWAKIGSLGLKGVGMAYGESIEWILSCIKYPHSRV